MLFCVSLRGAETGTNNTVPASTNFQWTVNGKLAGDSAFVKATNGFGAALFLTEDENFFQEWDKPETPHLRLASRARRGVPLFTIVTFVDPGQRPDKTADVKFDITVKKPDGSVYGEQKDMIGSQYKTDKAAGQQQIARDYMGIQIEPEDPAGTYTVEAVVKDNVRKVELHLTHQFTVEK